MMRGNMLQLTGLAKHYDALPVFSAVSLSLARGEFVACWVNRASASPRC
jgi:ABC-type Fe3+/spermidine/putrescine transport system ATPase subunit